jgi:hypothetical protein
MKKNREKIYISNFYPNLINVGPFNKVKGLEKNPELINIGPTFILESKVLENGFWTEF